MALALSAAVDLWRIQMRTQRTEEHEAGEGNDPEVPGVDDVAAV